MNKTAKKISLILAVMLMVAMLMTTAMALQHYATNWNIPGSDQRSRTHNWVVQATSSSMYIRTKADTVNVGAEDTYYKVAISAGGSAAGQVKCNLGILTKKSISGTYYVGDSHGTYAWRVDSTLNTDIVDGLTYIHS